MDDRVASAIAHWAPRFTTNGVTVSDFQRITGQVERWQDWCAAWSRVGAEHESLGRAALEQGGTSFDALYVNVNGESGYFDRSLEVYGRRDQPCSRCGTPIRRDPFMNRSAYTCPTCQPRPRRGSW